MEELLSIQNLETCQITQTIHLYGRAILFYKLYTMIFRCIDTTNVYVERNGKKKEEKMKDQLLAHV